jgi:hypothetical protein
MLIVCCFRLEKIYGMVRPARVRLARSPGYATVAPPFVGNGFLPAGVNRARDKGPFPVGIAGMDVITCFGLPAARADKVKTAHEIFRKYNVFVILAVDF